MGSGTLFPMSRQWFSPFGALALAVLSTAAGCAGVRGAQLYASGTEALDAGRHAHAVEDLEAAARLLPEASEVHNHLGLAYARVGRDAEALGAFERAVDLDCDNDAAQHNLQAARAGRLLPPVAAEPRAPKGESHE